VQIALAAVAGVGHVSDRDLFVLYSDLIDAALSEASRKAIQMLPQGYQFQSESLRQSFEKGRAAEKAADVLDVLDARGLVVTSEHRERILGSADIETLKLWIRRAAAEVSVDARLRIGVKARHVAHRLQLVIREHRALGVVLPRR